jgi:hypothetical protein
LQLIVTFVEKGSQIKMLQRLARQTLENRQKRSPRRNMNWLAKMLLLLPEQRELLAMAATWPAQRVPCLFVSKMSYLHTAN